MESSIKIKVDESLNLRGLPPSFFKKNRRNFLQNLKAKVTGLEHNSILLLEGGKEHYRYDSDSNFHFFMQEPNFYYLTGVTEAGFWAIIDIQAESLSLYVPLPNETTKIFYNPETLEEISKKYDAQTNDYAQLSEIVKERNPTKIYVLSGVNSDSDLHFATPHYQFPEASKDEENLNKRYDHNGLIYEILADTRVTKTAEELEVLSFLNAQTIKGHVHTIKSLKAGMMELDVENTFWKYMASNTYTRNHPYEEICGCGEHGAILHCLPETTKLEDGQLILMDMGSKLCGYVSDVTSTVPVSGKFTEKQKKVYDIVLKANREVQANAKPGVKWIDMHLLAEKIILTGLVDLKILNNNYPIDEMLKARVGFYFMPHGLGHLMGLDVHDAGGYLSFTPPRNPLPGLSSLRCGRVLTENTVITVEPGIYFVPFLLQKAYDDLDLSKYFNKEVLETYMTFGGIRIEDDIVITETGCRNMTEGIPRTTEEIEACMKKE